MIVEIWANYIGEIFGIIEYFYYICNVNKKKYDEIFGAIY